MRKKNRIGHSVHPKWTWTTWLVNYIFFCSCIMPRLFRFQRLETTTDFGSMVFREDEKTLRRAAHLLLPFYFGQYLAESKKSQNFLTVRAREMTKWCWACEKSNTRNIKDGRGNATIDIRRRLRIQRDTQTKMIGRPHELTQLPKTQSQKKGLPTKFILEESGAWILVMSPYCCCWELEIFTPPSLARTPPSPYH